MLRSNRKQQWCSGKYLFGGTHGQRGARAYNGVWGQSPQRGPGAEPLVGGQGGEASLKLKRFYVLDMQWKQQTCLTNYNSLYFGNWVNRCYSWYLSKTEVQSLQWSPGAKQLFTRSKTFRVEQHKYEGWTDTAGSKETEFTISLCVVPYRAIRCIRYSGLLDNLLVYQNVRWKLLILVQYTTS